MSLLIFWRNPRRFTRYTPPRTAGTGLDQQTTMRDRTVVLDARHSRATVESGGYGTPSDTAARAIEPVGRDESSRTGTEKEVVMEDVYPVPGG